MIFTNHADKVSCSGVSHIGISDHSLVYVYRKLSSDLSSKGHSYISYRNFRNFNRDNFRNEISQQDWSLDESEDPNLVWSNWKTKFLRVVNSYAPIRTRRAKLNNSPWINSVLKNDMRCRDAAKKKAIETKNPHDWANYRKLRNKINNKVKTISHDLEKLRKWLVSTKLTLNATKTEFMLIGSRQRLSTLSDTLELSIDNVPIEKVSSVKSHGIYVDENLTWHFHVDKLCKKIASAIGAIKRVKPFVPQSTLPGIYNSLVQPHFDYCSLVWGNCGKTLSNKLQKLQNRAARVITSSNYDADVNSLFHKLSWKDLNSQSQIQKALMVFKSLNGLVPEYLTSKFVARNVLNYALRNSANKYVVPFQRTNYMKNSFSSSGATLWNRLHRNIKESSSIDQFKRLLYQNFFKYTAFMEIRSVGSLFCKLM